MDKALRCIISKLFAGLIITVLIFCIHACGTKNRESDRQAQELWFPELVLYCENGVSAPLDSICKQFERMYKCRITIQNGNIRNLVSIIADTQTGDLFIPDIRSGFDILREIQPNIIGDSLYIGTNTLVFIVPKGNPEGFNGDIISMQDEEYAVIIANPETSSLGSVTRQILSTAGVYSEVLNNSIALSVDNRGIIRRIHNGEASLGLDWISSFYYNGNIGKVDTVHLSIPDTRYDVYASVLKTSRYPGLAHTFLSMLNSPVGADIFRSHGIYRKSQLELQSNLIPEDGKSRN